MKITVVTTIFPPDIGGPAIYASEVLNRMGQKGHQIKVVTSSVSAQPSKDVYVVPRRHLTPRFIGFAYDHIALLLKILRVSRGGNVIFTLNPAFLGLVSLLAAKILRKPLILRFAGDAAWEGAFAGRQTEKTYEEFLKSPEGSGNVKMLLTIQRFVLKRANRIIVPSQFFKEMVVKYYRVDPGKVKVIHNAIAPEVLSSRSESPEKFGKPCLITIGRLIRIKRIEGIIRVTKEISKTYPDVGLLIVGEGPEEQSLRELSREIGINDRVRFEGRLSHAGTMRLLQNSDIFVLNSIHENFPFTVIEAMACRVPVVATDIAALREIIEDGETGLLVPPNDTRKLNEKVVQLIENEELRTKLVENALEVVKQKFTWENSLGLLETELNELAESKLPNQLAAKSKVKDG